MTKRRKLLYLFVVLASAIALIFFLRCKPSQELETFPVPVSATLVKSNHAYKLETYKWNLASEENGLPLYYRTILHIKGWEKVYQEGAMSVYQKDKIVVEVITGTDIMFIHVAS